MADEPVIPGRVYGVRVWCLGDDGVLKGPYAGDAWPPAATMEARCHDDHRAPDPDCSCGLYAVHPFAADGADLPGHPTAVTGIVEAWGDVELHRDGFRAQYARPYALVVPSDPHDPQIRRVRETARSYGVPLIDAHDLLDLEDYCAEHGLGMSRETVEALLASAPPRPAPVVAPSPGRTVAASVLALAAVVAAVLLVAANWRTLERWAKGAPPPPPLAAEQHLHVVADSVVDEGDGTAVYVALVRNDDRWLTALGIWADGSVRTSGGITSLGGEYSQDARPTLAPGETGLLLDTLPATDGRALAIHVRLRARAFRAGRTSPAVTFGPVRLDRRRCLASAPTHSDRTRRTIDLDVFPSGRRWFLDAVPATIGPVPRGVSRQYLVRVGPRTCRARAGHLTAVATVPAGGRPVAQRPT